MGNWEQYGGNRFRASAGKELWGTKWKDLLLGGVSEDKVDCIAFVKIPERWLETLKPLPGRDNVIIIPKDLLVPRGNEHFLLPFHIVKIYSLRHAEFTGPLALDDSDSEEVTHVT